MSLRRLPCPLHALWPLQVAGDGCSESLLMIILRLHFFCRGGLGESCLGIDGPDDSLCLGNLGCSRSGNPTCGGLSAECGASGLYSYDDLPNHSACSSGMSLIFRFRFDQADDVSTGLCDPETLICSHSTLRYQSPQLTLTGNSRRPTWKTTPTENAFTCAPGETICPISSPRAASSGFEFACVQTASSTSHCGGCATSEEFIGAGFDRSGVDCSKLEGVESSGCVDSKCRVFSCIVGYEYRGRFNACARKKYW